MTTATVAPPEAEQSSVAEESERLSVLGRLWRVAPKFLMGTGVVMVLFAVFQIWGTGFQESRAQARLRDNFELLVDADAKVASVEPAPESSPTGPAVAPRSVAAVTTGNDPADAVRSGFDLEPSDRADVLDTIERGSSERGDTDPGNTVFIPLGGEALARLEIPAIDVDKIAVNSVDVAALRLGPGHYPTTVLPGNKGNSALAGHRTTYGAPFGDIDQLVRGDEIVITTVDGKFTYRVMDPTVAFAGRLDDVDSVDGGHIIVDPAATWVLGYFGDDRLTLTACHPKFTARQRIIVAAELVGAPVGSASAPIEQALSASDAPVDLGAAEEEASVERQPADTTTGGAGTDPTPGVPSGVDASRRATPDPTLALGSAGLDEGLGGERNAVLPAMMWLFAAVAIWTGAGSCARRWLKGRMSGHATRLVAAAPVVVCLWFCFEAADRALPAY